VSRSKQLCKAGDTHLAPMTKSQNISQVGLATLLKYSTDVLSSERTMFACHDPWPQPSSAQACCPVGVPRHHQHEPHGWTTAVNVKRLLTPRQSPGASLGGWKVGYLGRGLGQ